MKEDNQGVQFLYNDTIIITLNIGNYDIHCIFIDNESLTYILYFDALTKMGISPN